MSSSSNVMLQTVCRLLCLLSMFRICFVRVLRPPRRLWLARGCCPQSSPCPAKPQHSRHCLGVRRHASLAGRLQGGHFADIITDSLRQTKSNDFAAPAAARSAEILPASLEPKQQRSYDDCSTVSWPPAQVSLASRISDAMHGQHTRTTTRDTGTLHADTQRSSAQVAGEAI